MKLADLRLVDGIKRPFLGPEVEGKLIDCKAADESAFAHRLLTLDEQPDGSVIVTAPGGLTIHIYRAAILSKTEQRQ